MDDQGTDAAGMQQGCSRDALCGGGVRSVAAHSLLIGAGTRPVFRMMDDAAQSESAATQSERNDDERTSHRGHCATSGGVGTTGINRGA